MYLYFNTQSCVLVVVFSSAHSFIDFIRHLFSRPEVKDKKLSFLSNRLCQDPLEDFLVVKGNKVALVTTQVLQNFNRTLRLSEL